MCKGEAETMTKYAINKHMLNAKIPREVKEEYKKEIKFVKAKYSKSLPSRIKSAIVELMFPMGLIYLLVVGIYLSMMILPQISDTINEWAEVNLIYYIISIVLIIAIIIMTVKAFGFIWDIFSDALTDRGEKYIEEKNKVIDKYNDIGYYPQYEKLSDVYSADGCCAYYDDYQEIFRCPIDDSPIPRENNLNYRCLSRNYSSCTECEKIKNIYSYFNV